MLHELTTAQTMRITFQGLNKQDIKVQGRLPASLPHRSA